jgi:hypothetical protein
MASRFTQIAAKLDISYSYLDMIYKGKRTPGYSLVQRLKKIVGKDFDMEWWRTAKISQIQRVIDSIK